MSNQAPKKMTHDSFSISDIHLSTTIVTPTSQLIDDDNKSLIIIEEEGLIPINIPLKEEVNHLNEGYSWDKEKRIWINTEHPDKPFVQSKKTDPFLYEEKNYYEVRYISACIKAIYPNPNEKFHIRGMHYVLLSMGFLFPFREGHDPNQKIHFRKYTNSKIIYNKLQEYLRAVRWLGTIDPTQIFDARIKTGIQPPNFKLYSNEVFKNTLDFKLDYQSNFNSYLKIPIIMLISEKEELEPIFDQLSQAYYLSYYVGAGEYSISAVREIYDFIKQFHTYAIILMFSDYDKAGDDIVKAFSRKIQYYIESEPEGIVKAPSIIIYRFMIDDIMAAEMRQKGIPMKENTKGSHLIYELAALKALSLLNHKSVFDYIQEHLEVFFLNSSFLWQRSIISNELADNRKEYLFQIGKSLGKSPVSATNSPAWDRSCQLDPKTNEILCNADAYLKSLTKEIENLPDYDRLQQVVENLHFEPKIITHPTEDQQSITKAWLDNLRKPSLVHASDYTSLSSDNIYKAMTERLLDATLHIPKTGDITDRFIAGTKTTSFLPMLSYSYQGEIIQLLKPVSLKEGKSWKTRSEIRDQLIGSSPAITQKLAFDQAWRNLQNNGYIDFADLKHLSITPEHADEYPHHLTWYITPKWDEEQSKKVPLATETVPVPKKSKKNKKKAK